MGAGRSSAWALLLGAALLAIARPALADRVDRLADKLESAPDFRVRTQAALALGASKSRRAVRPLCRGLEDSNTTVRAASAAALGKLKKGGGKCLESRLDDEPSSSVKRVIRRSIKRLRKAGAAGGAEDLGKLGSTTDYYVAIDETNDKTGRDVDGLVRSSIVKELRGEEGIVVAPTGQTTSEAKKLLAGYKKVTGFFLMPKVKKPRYKNGDLRVKVQLTVFTYPSKAMKGMITKKFTQQGTGSKDRKAEDELIELGMRKATAKFLKNIERFE